MSLHYAVDALGFGCCAPSLLSLAAQQGMDAPIAIGRQSGAEHVDVGDQLGVGQWRSPPLPGRRSVVHSRQVLATDAEGVGNRGHWPSPDNEVERNSSFLRRLVRDPGAVPVIPGRRNRKRIIRYDKQRYAGRHLIENAFSRLKKFRRVATRYNKRPANFLSGVALATALAFWLLMSLGPRCSVPASGGSGRR